MAKRIAPDWRMTLRSSACDLSAACGRRHHPIGMRASRRQRQSPRSSCAARATQLSLGSRPQRADRSQSPQVNSRIRRRVSTTFASRVNMKRNGSSGDMAKPSNIVKFYPQFGTNGLIEINPSTCQPRVGIVGSIGRSRRERSDMQDGPSCIQRAIPDFAGAQSGLLLATRNTTG